MLCRFWLVMVTVWGALVDPTAWLPKLTDVGVAFTFACAAAANATQSAAAATTVLILLFTAWNLFSFFIAGPPTCWQISSGPVGLRLVERTEQGQASEEHLGLAESGLGDRGRGWAAHFGRTVQKSPQGRGQPGMAVLRNREWDCAAGSGVLA